MEHVRKGRGRSAGLADAAQADERGGIFITDRGDVVTRADRGAPSQGRAASTRGTDAKTAGGAAEGGAGAGGAQVQLPQAAAQGSGPMGLCRVCGAALPTSRDTQPVVTCQRSLRYATKHGFCVSHLKAESFVLAGEQVRFCQKCSRLQPLSEAVNRTCQEKLKAHNARSRERYAAGEGNKKRRVRRGGASEEESGGAVDGSGAAPSMLVPGAALHSAQGGWAGSARSMAEPQDFTAAQLQMLSGSFTTSLLAGWPPSQSNADQVMQLLLSHSGAPPPWASQVAPGTGGNPFQVGQPTGGFPAHALLQQAQYTQVPPVAAQHGAWPMSELFAPLGSTVLEDGTPAAALMMPPPPNILGGGAGVPPGSS